MCLQHRVIFQVLAYGGIKYAMFAHRSQELCWQKRRVLSLRGHQTVRVGSKVVQQCPPVVRPGNCSLRRPAALLNDG